MSQGESPLEILVFEVGGQRYGLSGSDVRELLRAVAIVPLPHAPAVVEGIINLRGRVVPVYDLRARFHLPPKVVSPTDHLIVACVDDRFVALRVDRAVDFVRLEPSAIENAQAAVPGAGYVTWMAKLSNELVLMHDLRTFLSRSEAAALTEAVAATEGGVMSWTHPTYEAVASQLGKYTGLTFPVHRREGVERSIHNAMTRAGVAELSRFWERLETDAKVLDDLIGELTIGETYFFREPEQFEVLRRRVLPEIRDRRGAEHTLRVWSAGCASGEEAYSLAILLKQEPAGSPASILATDLSRAVLAKARRGNYTVWSLRGGGAEAARPYLRPQGERFQIDEGIRRRVAFEYLNLALDVYPSLATGTGGMDLILCRNVLIYFDRETIRRVAGRLFECLAPGGWLLTASSDPPLADAAPFEVQVTESGLCYRRPPVPLVETRMWVADEPVPNFASLAPAYLEEGLEPPQEGATYGMAQSRTPPPPSPTRREKSRAAKPRTSPPSPQTGEEKTGKPRTLPTPPQTGGEKTRVAIGLQDAGTAAAQVRALANLDPERAAQTCSAAAAKYPLSAELHYLRAVLLLGLDQLAEAAAAGRKALYLDPSLAVAHFVLGAIHARRGDRIGAGRAYRNARDLCTGRPADEIVSLSDGEPAGRLAEAAAAQLAVLEAAEEAP